MLLDDIVQMCELLGHDGYTMQELWSENLWVDDVNGHKIATAFVLQDAIGRQFDVHAMCFDVQGNGIPVWEESEEFIFEKQDLAGMGMIAGLAVQCITPEKQMLCHAGYGLPVKQLGDLELLHEKFDIAYLEAYDRTQPVTTQNC